MADVVVVPANVRTKSAGRIEIVTVGEAVTQGQTGYQDTTTLKYMRGRATTQALSQVEGVFLTSASGDNETAVFAFTGTDIDLGATLTVGVQYVVSANLGGIAPIADLVAGNWVTTLGVATAANRLALRINRWNIQRA